MAMTGGTAKLVKTTYPFSDKTKAVNLYIYYKTSQNVSTNKSTITCGMYVTTPSGWDIGQWDDFQSASYVGTTSNTFNGTVPNFSGTRWIAENKTFTVDHNADGTGKATIQWKWAVNSPWGGYINPSGSFSIDLPQIPRATTPTLSATSAQMGKTITVTMNRASSSFTHTLKYTINGTTGTIGSGLGTSHTWTIPKTLVAHIPNKVTSSVTITCETWSGGTLIGSKTVSFTATVPDASIPKMSTYSVQIGNSVTISIPREAAQYTHNLKFILNGTTFTIAENVATSYTWKVPDLTSLIPNATSGTATIICITKNGTANVGQVAISIKITALPATVPTVSVDRRQMGFPITIYTNGKSDKYTHDLIYTMGKKTGIIATGIASSALWLVPTDLVSETPNATSGTLTITCITKNGTATVGTEYIKITIDVPKASVPSSDASEAVMGLPVTIKTNRIVPEYTHNLYYTFSEKPGINGEPILIASNVTDSFAWEIPLDLAKDIPSATYGYATIVCVTKNGTANLKTETFSLKLTVPDNEITQPVFTMSFAPVHSLSSAFDGLFIQGKSKVSVTFSAESEYSLVKSYSFKVAGSTKSGNPATSELLVSNGSIAIEGTVTDYRGYSKTVTDHITVIPYSKPKIVAYDGENSVICTRSRKDGTISRDGVYVLVKASSSYSKVISGSTQHNNCRIWYRYKTANASDYSVDWVPLTGEKINTVPDHEFDIKTAYTFQLRVEDDVGEERVYTYPIAYLSVPVHMGKGGKNLGLGQFCNYSEAERIDVGWKTYFNTGIGKKVIFETSGGATGWSEGALNDVITGADATSVMNYNLFIAVVKELVGSGGKSYPILCVRNSTNICGSFDSISAHMSYSTDQNTIELTSITDGYTITALYALL